MSATQQMLLAAGGTPPSFSLPLLDSGAGAVNTTPNIAAGSPTPTFTRATTAWTKLSTGLWASVATGVARSSYLGSNTAVGAYGGYLAEGAGTNLALQARDLSNASWTKLNTTGAKDQAGIDGVANSASSLTATLGGGTCLQTITEAATLSALSIFIKRITGTGTVTIQQGVSTLEVSASLNTNTYTRVEIDATVLNPIIGIALGTNGDAIAVDMAQFENGAFASSPIPTTTIAVTRNADVLKYPAAGGNFGNTAGTAYAEYTSSAIGPGAVIVDSTTSAYPLYTSIVSENFPARTFDGTNATNVSLVVSGVVKGASKWSGITMQNFANGLAGTVGIFSGNFGVTTISIGINSNSNIPLFGTIRNVRIYPTALSAAQLQAMTTP